MLNEEIENMLFQSQNIFKANNGLSPLIFMRMKDKKDLVVEEIDMSSIYATDDTLQRLKNMIESGELEQYLFMKEIKSPNGEWILMIIKANKTQELQWVCDVSLVDDVYKFSEWILYDSTKMKAKKKSFNNLFGQVFCNYN